MSINPASKKLHTLLVVTYLTLAVFACSFYGCTQASDHDQPSTDDIEEDSELSTGVPPPITPKTGFGKAIGNAKDLSKTMNEKAQSLDDELDHHE